jgi:hypothetical protein
MNGKTLHTGEANDGEIAIYLCNKCTACHGR